MILNTCLIKKKLMEDSNYENSYGALIISLDFELYWGIRDVKETHEYQSNLEGTKIAISGILNLFKKYNIHATWASVGFLFAKNTTELREYFPKIMPTYDNLSLNPYEYLKDNDEIKPNFHFAPEVIEKISNTSFQELATHTFSHFYTLEEGQTKEQFFNDINSANDIASKLGIKIKSIVFPRNQINSDYLPILSKFDITSFRGAQRSWLNFAPKNGKNNIIKRGLRLLDSYVNLTGSNTFSNSSISIEKPINIPSSRFLRPFSAKLSFFEVLKKHRIKKSIKKAAQNKENFHLWWHPHNFGKNTQENLELLEEILIYFDYMRKKYGIESLNMNEVSNRIS